MKSKTPIVSATAAALLGLAFLSAPAYAADAAAPQPYAVMHADATGSYAVDPDHSSVSWVIGHAGIVPCAGVFKKVSGTFTFDPVNAAADKADITVAVDSIDSYMPLRNEHLKSANFFDAAKYPDIHFVSTRYVPEGKDAGKLYGNITLHGVTKPAVFNVTLEGAGKVGYLPKPWGGFLGGFVATTTVDRMDFGISAYPAGLSHTVDITVRVEGVRQGS